MQQGAPSYKRMLSTLDEILNPPQEGGLVSNSLTNRYNLRTNEDKLVGEKGTFNICSF